MISVIVLTYNNIDILDKCLESIFHQTFKNYEVIFIDNCSSDGTYEKLLKIDKPNIKIFQSKNIGNMAASRNIGIRNSKYEYLAFHDSDDFWYPSKLEEISKYIDKYDLVYHDFDIFSEVNNKRLRKKKISN
tara:strand:+ start:208 stop:603 length:396 start_codon:yes stop_codon:yes gene_type:complete